MTISHLGTHLDGIYRHSHIANVCAQLIEVYVAVGVDPALACAPIVGNARDDAGLVRYQMLDKHGAIIRPKKTGDAPEWRVDAVAARMGLFHDVL